MALGFRRFAAFWTRTGDRWHAAPHSVFHQFQKHVPWNAFDRFVDEHKADHRVRTLTTKGQFLALLFGQLAGAVSLREIEAGLASQQSRLYQVGGRCVARTTLAEANPRRPAAVFSGLFAHIAATASRRTRRHICDAVRSLDATRIELSSLRSGWADMVGGHRAIKLHASYDPHANTPSRPMSPARKPTTSPRPRPCTSSLA